MLSNQKENSVHIYWYTLYICIRLFLRWNDKNRFREIIPNPASNYFRAHHDWHILGRDHALLAVVAPFIFITKGHCGSEGIFKIYSNWGPQSISGGPIYLCGDIYIIPPPPPPPPRIDNWEPPPPTHQLGPTLRKYILLGPSEPPWYVMDGRAIRNAHSKSRHIYLWLVQIMACLQLYTYIYLFIYAITFMHDARFGNAFKIYLDCSNAKLGDVVVNLITTKIESWFV